ncbi:MULTISPECIES: LysR family transcriptional regulator ArgP [Tsukamurella]|uniref:LysR family transcriptional regulator ArgP n=2 Tax=Tsukamurella TaxID=2060 RepID=A0A5C5RWG6_9ACTN|nr:MULTISPECIES: LysR family transcriptional regulator ArgP [Tsukamurella]NMD57955.1 LysR family transcriptional regulator ArgP [Tsukamurella columbiensis]TWS26853.1 LysR family transcriptional regulator ArgP [Tsukamurella conjunctivitidis]
MLSGHHLETLIAVVEEESFGAAASRLRITQSAVSQRIRALEQQVGHVVVTREGPCRPTAQGEVLLGLARGVASLEADALGRLAGGARSAVLDVGVNADSLATWFRDVIAAVAALPDGPLLRLVVDDEHHTADLLRAGSVLAAITTDPEPVQGCAVEYLGTMRYLPVCTPAYAARWRIAGRWRWREMPVVQFDLRKDELQNKVLHRRGIKEAPPMHRIPSSEAFTHAVRAGLGWGSLPEADLGDALDRGALIRLTDDTVDVKLYWQSWRLHTRATERLADAIHAAAAVHLR